MSIAPNSFNTSTDMAATTSPYRPSQSPRLGRGLHHIFIKPTPVTSASPADQLCHISWTGGFASASQPLPASPCRRFIAHQAMGMQIESQFWEPLFFGLLQQTNQVPLILAIFACLGLFFPRNYYSGLFDHLYTGLSNGGCINDGRVVARSVSIHSSANDRIRNLDRPVI